MPSALGGGDAVGPYEVERLLGRGAFSETYLATDARSGARVVLKFPDTALIGDPAVFERFQRELAIGKQLVHPGIARAIAIEQSDLGPYLVVQYIEGESFRSYLSEHAPLEAAEAVDIGIQIADALAYAHRHGVFHRDLKPENLIIGEDRSLHIVDFGIALLEGARRMTWRFVSERLGTPDYMAPEQIQGKRGDARTDIYALGIMLYEMLAGRVPFEGDNALSVMSQHVSASPVPPRQIRPAIPAGLEAIVLKAIRKDPDERYQMADDLASDLRRYPEIGAAAFAFPPERLQRYSETRSMIIGALVGFAVIAAGALAVLVGYLLHR